MSCGKLRIRKCYEYDWGGVGLWGIRGGVLEYWGVEHWEGGVSGLLGGRDVDGVFRSRSLVFRFVLRTMEGLGGFLVTSQKGTPRRGVARQP